MHLLDVEVAAGSETKSHDTRSFIMSRPQLQESSPRIQQHLQAKEEDYPNMPRTVQPWYIHTDTHFMALWYLHCSFLGGCLSIKNSVCMVQLALVNETTVIQKT